jgi:hypothetical protein
MAKRRPTAWCLLTAILGMGACASTQVADSPCAFVLPAATGWTTYDEGGFSIQLPPDYVRGPAYSIDSKVGSWTSGGKGVSYDFGFYSNPLQQNDQNPLLGFLLCQESAGPRAPRVIRYMWPDGKSGIGAHWPGLRHSAFMGDESLTVSGRVEKVVDLAELIAIIRSVRINAR